MKLLILVLISIWLVGCIESRSISHMSIPACKEEVDRKKLAEFIIKCSEAANPKSDEEGEDLVAQCERTGKRVLCPKEHLCQETHYTRIGLQRFGSWMDCEAMEKKR